MSPYRPWECQPGYRPLHYEVAQWVRYARKSRTALVSPVQSGMPTGNYWQLQIRFRGVVMSEISLQSERIVWGWEGASIDTDWYGHGPTVLLLPALSSISTRREMLPLQERLGAQFQTVSTDWPGFGNRPRPQMDWRPEIYAAFLAFLIGKLKPSHLHAVVAAGHAATYALAQACAHPNSFDRLVLIAPTWRGPLPTMMSGHRPLFDRICRMVDWPVVGSVLYRLNVNRLVIRYMAAGHVYSDPGWSRLPIAALGFPRPKVPSSIS